MRFRDVDWRGRAWDDLFTAAISLAIVVMVFRHRADVDVDDISVMKG